MRKYPAILLAVLLLLAACSAEIVTQLPDEPVKEDSGSVFVEAVSGNQIRVGFTPVAFADSYSYVLGTEETKIPVSSYEMIDGNVSFVVESDMKGTITIYAEKTGEEPVRIASQDFDLSIAGLAPNVYISARSVDGVTLMLASGADNNITYKVDIHLRDGDFVRTEYLKAEDSEIHITGLEAESSYSLYVSQSLDGVNYSEANQIDVGAFSQDSNQTIELSISNDILTATGITGTVANLYKTDSLSSSSTPVLVLENIQVTDGKATVEAKTSLKSLESGYFYFECDDAYSNVVKYVSPVHLDDVGDSVQENWKSALVAIDFADDVIPSDYRVSVEGANSGASATIVEGGVMISNLDSNSTFSVNLIFTSTETLFSARVTNIAIETRSFVGTYEWKGGLSDGSSVAYTNFRVKVKDDVPESSTYPYYVYFDTTGEVGDQSVLNQGLAGQTLRIMPLVDTSAGEPQPPANGVSCTPENSPQFADFTEAYNANETKWKKPSMTSDFFKSKWWSVLENNGDIATEKDVVTTVTNTSTSKSNNGSLPYVTRTTFAFIELDTDNDGVMEPYVKFVNIGEGFVALGLVTNADPENLENLADTSTLPNTWYLAQVSEEV